ncbi:hypothetical protein MKZ38_006703 [Zalerion maritima]|uniref:Major facilitator superfamily (MFS) profile domain-containing protein n=1 Tax=Zalerion maritima TaxID=339359 RepID=A0AAD5RJU4_9PEZI|nr:hypothetical protein MKZ38_006703 [Zalerion maritima]
MAAFKDVTFYLLLFIGICTIGPLQFGFHLAELNAPQDVLMCRKKAITTRRRWHRLFPNRTDSDKPIVPEPGFLSLPSCIPMNDAAFAAISSVFTLGGLAGALYAGPFSSRKGRLLAMRATACFFILGSLVETVAGAVWVMGVGRFFTGIGAGAATVIVPLYISEISPKNKRGFFGFFTQISVNVGILGVQVLGYFLSHDQAWRWILGSGVIVGAAQFLGLSVVPESPAWMAAHGDPVESRRIFKRIRGKNATGLGEEVGRIGDESRTASEEEALLADAASSVGSPLTTVTSAQAHKNVLPHLGFMQVAKDPFYRPAIVAVVGIMFTQQFCGINSVIMYSVSLLTGLLPISSALLTILISVVNLFITIACAPLPDRLGRKTCLLISACGQGTSAFVLALSIVLGQKIISAFAVLFFVGFFAVGLGPVPFMLASELVGQEAVGATQSWCLAANYTATFIVAQFFPIINVALNEILGGAGWVYFLFTAFAAAGAIFIFVCVPETRGKKDADEVWGRVRRLD